MGCCASCFGGQSPEEIEREKLASEEVRQNAAKAAQQRLERDGSVFRLANGKVYIKSLGK